ncbi:hypothetical protein H0H87_001505 [Tephrocybe sp. NHM501043]|nr:hypothetical protein H0H87_001505 [Tephrocybe sp. NHM501043]
MPTRQRRASLVIYLNPPSITLSLPSLPFGALQNALNAQKHTPGNNDVLEFIGDHVVNLACALMASKINHSPAQQTLVARRLSNNDTLGRISHQIRLPQHACALLDPGDRRAAEAWARSQSGSPPKLFADIFESYTGALFLRHGWHYTHAWLRKVYAPIIAAAARDVFITTDVATSRWSKSDDQLWPQRAQWTYEDYIEEHGAEIKETTKVTSPEDAAKSSICIDALLTTFEHLDINSTSKSGSTEASSDQTKFHKTQDCLTKVKLKASKKFTIKISASWLLDGDNSEAKDSDPDIDDPYKLDEGGEFPALTTKVVNSQSGNIDDISEDLPASEGNIGETVLSPGTDIKEKTDTSTTKLGAREPRTLKGPESDSDGS